MIKIMVDSGSDCRDKAVYDIFMPISVRMDGREYYDGVDLTSDEFYRLLSQTKEFPATSQPSPEAFIEEFEKSKADGDDLLYFALSSGVSGTYQGARIAQSMVDYNRIYVIDTLGVTHMIGILAAYAKKRIEEGAVAKQIAMECEELKGRIRVYAGVDTLEYLRRGGRLSGGAAAVGTLANIKPIVTANAQGKVEAVGKAIGIGKAIGWIVDKVTADEVDSDFPVMSLSTVGEENVRRLEEKAEASGIRVTSRLQIGPTIGAHVGPGVYGLLYVAKTAR